MPAPHETAAAALMAAAAPLLAYCQRTPRPHRHADQLDALLAALGTYGAAVHGALAPLPHLAALAERYAPPPDVPDPLAARIRRHLAHLDDLDEQPCSPAEYALRRSITSHHLGIPASF